MDQQKITVLIPAHNEAEFIFDTVTAVKGIAEVDEIIVIDDCSTDSTSLLAEKAGATVLKLASNLGKGGALNVGLDNTHDEIIAFLDGDVGKTGSELRKLIMPVLAGEADMTIAKFPKSTKKAGFGLVKNLAIWGIRHFSGLQVEAPLSGQRVFSPAAVKIISPVASGYGVEVGLTIDVARAGLKVLEIPVEMTHAATGRDLKGFMHRGKQFVHVMQELLKQLLKQFLKR